MDRARTVRRVTIAICLILVVVTTTVSWYRLGWETPIDIRPDRSVLREFVWSILFSIPFVLLQCIPLYVFAKSIRSKVSVWVTSLLLLIVFAFVYLHPVKDVWRPGSLTALNFIALTFLWGLVIGIGQGFERWETKGIKPLHK